MKAAFLISALLTLLNGQAFAQTCLSESNVLAQVKEHGGTWVEMTSDQWQFLRGIYATNPETPPGLPPGNMAALALKDGEDGLVFFIDDDQVCQNMRAPKVLVDLLDAVKSGKITHVGSPM